MIRIKRLKELREMVVHARDPIGRQECKRLPDTSMVGRNAHLALSYRF